MNARVRARRIVLLSDQNLFRESLERLLRKDGRGEVVTYRTLDTLLAGEREFQPDVLLVDLDHELVDTHTLVDALRRALPSANLVLIGTARRQAAVVAPAEGQVETPDADVLHLVEALERVRGPSTSSELTRQRRLWARITPRQREVLRWLAVGLDNRGIARRLQIGERAVKAHVSALLEELGVDNRTQLALLAHDAGVRPTLAEAQV
jgi:DNA-binding NarL/FixJ family response regulator